VLEQVASPAKRSDPELSCATETYLKAVLELEEVGADPIRSRVADRLGHAVPTVSITVGRMAKRGLLDVGDADRRLRLTPEGQHVAVRVIRWHRLAECFLHDELGLPWERVHDEASRWEQAFSWESAERLDRRLGHPTRTPYGTSIPSADERRWASFPGPIDALSLTEAVLAGDSSPTASLRLSWIGEGAQAAPGQLASFAQAGLAPGARLSAELERDGVVIRAESGGGELTVPHAVAAQLFVTE